MPAILAATLWRDRWKSALAWLMVSMVIDLDHLLADPIYDPNRCSLAVHPMHGLAACCFYVLLTLPRKTRLLGIGLVIHILLDGMECYRIGDFP